VKGPRVSGLLPVRNGERWIDKSLSNILSTLRKDDELIIINNGSVDNSQSLLSRYAKSDARIVLIQTADIGLVAALNLGIAECSHEWVARYDIDDIYDKYRLENQRLLVSEGTSAIFTDYSFRNETGKFLGTVLGAVFEEPTKISLINSERTAHSSVLFNREAVNEVGNYLANEFPAEDLGLWFRLARMGKLVSSPTLDLQYSLIQDSITGHNYKKALRAGREMKIKYTDKDWATRGFLNFEATCLAYERIPNGHLRLLLHIRDLLNPTLFYELPLPQKRLIRQRLFNLVLREESFRKVPPLLYWKVRRYIYRL
jgi:glycosyltransferase involved in cell wall biosynthesis